MHHLCSIHFYEPKHIASDILDIKLILDLFYPVDWFKRLLRFLFDDTFAKAWMIKESYFNWARMRLKFLSSSTSILAIGIIIIIDAGFSQLIVQLSGLHDRTKAYLIDYVRTIRFIMDLCEGLGVKLTAILESETPNFVRLLDL